MHSKIRQTEKTVIPFFNQIAGRVVIKNGSSYWVGDEGDRVWKPFLEQLKNLRSCFDSACNSLQLESMRHQDQSHKKGNPGVL